VATLKGRVLLARRRLEGRFGGMWEPPSLVGEDARALEEAWPLRALEAVGSVRHVLSHRRLEVKVFRARLTRTPRRTQGEYDAAELVDLESIESRGITTLAKKILRAAR
jgi:adenine-specific DNA glycosylase